MTSADWLFATIVVATPEKSSELSWWVGSIVGCVFAVTIVMAVVYFVAISRKDTR